MFNRITATTPLPGDLLFWSLTGREALSEPFVFDVELLSTRNRLDKTALLGKPMTVTIPLPCSLSQRHLNGKITTVDIRSQELSGTRYTVYRLRMESDLWPLLHDRNQRIFQNQSVPDIIKTLLSENNIVFEERLNGSYRLWEYCVQYQETSFNFISRLMELEGIYYYFEHDAEHHTLILTDDVTGHTPFPGYETIRYQSTPSGGATDEEGISQWRVRHDAKPGLYSLNDYDFRKPYAELLQARQNPVAPQPGAVDVYDWPGHYVESGQGEDYARIRQQVWQASHQILSGTATALGIAPGRTFSLYQTPFFSDDGEYTVTSATYDLRENRYASGSDTSQHLIDFTVIPKDVQFRAPPSARWPRTYGPQTARVVCPEGQSIWTDKYGRVKVKFHWDRLAKGDDTSSCWVRVSSAWASQGFGGVQIPRVNDEVVVDFINGDPDRPIITGRVYNDANMPPWGLPDNATQMGFFSRSKDGTPDNANALRFEDKPGQEQVWIHAERNMDTDIEHDETRWVGNDQTETVIGHQTISVHKNETETVGGNQTLTVKKNQVETVFLTKAESIGIAKALSIGAAYQTTVGMAMNTSVGLSQSSQIGMVKSLWVGQSYTTDIGQTVTYTVGERKTETVGNVSIHNVGDHFELVCGKARIVLTKDGGIYLQGSNINLLAESSLSGDAGTTQWNCGAASEPPATPTDNK